MIIGLSEQNFNIIKNIIKKYPAEFYAFGSRVKGDFTELSDLDLLVKSDNYDEISQNLREDFDSSLLPFVVNIADYNSIDKSFYKLIEKDLVKLEI
jgi:predicted nucleotidyltransferase